MKQFLDNSYRKKILQSNEHIMLQMQNTGKNSHLSRKIAEALVSNFSFNN